MESLPGWGSNDGELRLSSDGTGPRVCSKGAGLAKVQGPKDELGNAFTFAYSQFYFFFSFIDSSKRGREGERERE